MGLRRSAMRGMKVWLVAMAIAAAGVVLASDGQEARAAHTSVFYTFSTTTPSAVTGLTTFPGGPAVTLHVWAANVDDAQGLGAFEVVLRYDPAYMQVGSITEHTGWLDDTGRAPSCLAPVIEPVPNDPQGLWRAKTVCFTITNPPPYGPLGSGKIAEFTILPGASFGVTQLTNLTVLTDPGQIIPPSYVVDPQVIPANEISAQIRTAKCGDVNDDNAVSGLDFFALLGRFGAVGSPNPSPNWNEIYDLDANNAVAGADFFILLGQFGINC